MFGSDFIQRDPDHLGGLQWIVERCGGRASAVQSALGWMPAASDLNWDGLDEATRANYPQMMSIERDAWIHELLLHEELFVKLYDKLPKEFVLKRELLLASLWRSPERWTVG